jgi:hypothetical protein
MRLSWVGFASGKVNSLVIRQASKEIDQHCILGIAAIHWTSGLWFEGTSRRAVSSVG